MSDEVKLTSGKRRRSEIEGRRERRSERERERERERGGRKVDK